MILGSRSLRNFISKVIIFKLCRRRWEGEVGITRHLVLTSFIGSFVSLLKKE